MSGETCVATKENGNVEVTDEVKFDLEAVLRHFEQCVTEDGEGIRIEYYLLGYRELYNFLNMLGTVFGWVASDVQAKIEVLHNHRNKDIEHYSDLKTMLDHETTTGVIKPKAKDSSTGARNFLRLHRALEYIYTFLDTVQDIDIGEKTCGISQESYKKTLIKFHPWVVQKAALLAMHMLPTKEDLIIKICGSTEEEKIQWASSVLQKAVAAMKKAYSITQDLYGKYELLNLP